MNEASKRAPRRRRRWLWITLGLTPLVLIAGGWIAARQSFSRRVDRAIAAADRDDPGWRIDELLAARDTVPDDENSARVVLEVKSKLPPGWMAGRIGQAQTAPDRLSNALGLVSSDEPNRPPGVAETEQLRTDLAPLEPAIAEARRLADLTRGRYLLPDVPLFVHLGLAALDHLQVAREVQRLLTLDILARARAGDLDGALDDVRAGINAGRSVGDEPTTNSQLVRIAIVESAIHNLQWVLAQGEASDDALARVETLLAEEAAAPTLLYAIRGERSGVVDTFARLAEGSVDMGQLATPKPLPPPKMTFGPHTLLFRYNEALALEVLGEAVAIARRPIADQVGAWDEFAKRNSMPESATARSLGSLVWLLVPAITSTGQASIRSKARLHTAQAMVAAERFRLANGRWPGSPDDLVPTYLTETPIDPYDAKPIRITQEGGVLILYSVGPDRQDDGGRVSPPPAGTNRGRSIAPDLGLRLWPPEDRGQDLPANVFAPE